MSAPWSCLCPHQYQDERGRVLGTCQLVASIEHDFELPSTSGPVRHVVTTCPAEHREMALYEALVLLG